jgi:drug/metabolite transporter (DMT)-like permease
VAGLALFAGYGFQTVGLQYTTASNAGFITGLSDVKLMLHLGP